MAGTPGNATILSEFYDPHFDKGVAYPDKISIKIDPAGNVDATTSANGLKLDTNICEAVNGKLSLSLDGDKLQLKCADGLITDVELPFPLPVNVERCYKKCPDPLTQPHAGQNLLNNPQFVDVMDIQVVMLDDDGSLSFYNGVNRTIQSNPTWKFLTGGGSLNNVAIKDAIADGRVVSFEDGYILFIEPVTGSVDFYNASSGAFDSGLSTVFSGTVLSGGPLAGKTLANAVGGLEPGWKYIGQTSGHFIFYNTTTKTLASYNESNFLNYEAFWSMGGVANPQLIGGGAFQGPLSAAMPNFLGVSEDRISFIDPVSGNWVAYNLATRSLAYNAIGQPLLPVCQTAQCTNDSCTLDTGATVARSFVVAQGYKIVACEDATPPAAAPGAMTCAQIGALYPTGVFDAAVDEVLTKNCKSVLLPPLADFFSSVTATADTIGLPNGTTDRTEKIRRDGSVGLLVDPLTTLDNGGSHSDNARIVNASTTAEGFNPTDSTVLITGTTNVTQPFNLPSAALFPRRIITLRFSNSLASTIRVSLTSAGGYIETPGDVDDTAQMPNTSAILTNKAVGSVTWQSIGGNWRVLDWHKRAYYPTNNYPPSPFGFATFNTLAGVQPAAGVAFAIPAGVTEYVTLDSAFTPFVQLPATNNATGRFSVHAANSPSFPTTVSLANTDLPRNTLIGGGESLHFEWSDGLWRWVYAPERPAPVMQAYSYKNPNPLPATVLTPNTNGNTGNIPNGTSAFQIVDGNYVAIASLPPVTAASVPIVIQRNSAFPVSVASTNTDMPTSLVLGLGECGRFVPSVVDNKWHWIDGEINPGGASGPATVSGTGLLTMGGQTIQLVRLVSSLGRPVIPGWVFPG